MAGNATITLFDGTNPQTYDVWIQSIATQTQTQFQSQQVKSGIEWTPIRRAEMFVRFSIMWPLVSMPIPNTRPDVGFEDIDPADGFAKMNKLQEAIFTHQKAMSLSSSNPPMVLNYYNNSDPNPNNRNPLISKDALTNLTYEGWIQVVEKEYARFKNYFIRQYTMNIVTKNTSNTAATSMVQGTNVTFAPTAADLKAYGKQWVDIGSLVSLSTNLLANAHLLPSTASGTAPSNINSSYLYTGNL